MNTERILAAARWMRFIDAQEDAFDMRLYRCPRKESIDEIATVLDAEASYETLHACGTSACFAGWLCVSPEWLAAGGRADDSGSPKFEGELAGAYSVAKYFGLSWQDAAALIHHRDGLGLASPYDKPFKGLTALDVAQRLERLAKEGAL